MKIRTLLIILLFTSKIYSQETACGLTDETSQNLLNCINSNFNFNNSIKLDKITNDILKKIGLEHKNFRVLSCNSVNNALAFNYNNERYIVADQIFLNYLNQNDKTNDYWFYLFILSHEIAHHLNGHTLKKEYNLENKRQQELECDRFAGMILRKYNANQNIIIDIMNKIPHPKQNDSSHPTKEKRVGAALEGYNFENTEIEKTIELYRREIEKTAIFFEVLNYHRKANNYAIDFLETYDFNYLDSAITYYEIVLKNYQSEIAIEGLAVLYSYKGDYKKAQSYFEKLYKKTKNESYLIKSFFCSHKLGETYEKNLDFINYKNLENIDDLINLFIYEYSKENINAIKCQELLNYGIEKFKDINVNSDFSDKKEYLNLLNNLTSLHLNTKNTNEALVGSEKFLTKLKELTNSKNLDELIFKYKNKNDYKSIEIKNSISDYLTSISFINSLNKDYLTSNYYLNKLHENYPNSSAINDYRYNFLLGKNYYWLKKYDEAEENLKKVIYSNSFLKDEAFINLGHIFKNKNDINKAKFYYEEACKLGNNGGCFLLNNIEKTNETDSYTIENAIDFLKKNKGNYDVSIFTVELKGEKWEKTNSEIGEVYIDLQSISYLKKGMEKPLFRELIFSFFDQKTNMIVFNSQYGYTLFSPEMTRVLFFDINNEKIFHEYSIIIKKD